MSARSTESLGSSHHASKPRVSWLNPALYANGTPQPPKNTGEAQYRLSLHCGLSVVIGNDRGFEGLIIHGIFQISNDCFGEWRTALPRAALCLRWRWGLDCIAPVSLNLLERAYEYSTHKIGFVLSGASTLQSGLIKA
jgi:hypothetical protein